MRKGVIIFCLVISGLIILDSLNVGYAFIMFLLAGVVPGTNFTISAANMLEMFALLIGFTLSRIAISLTRLVASYRFSTSTGRPTPPAVTARA